MKYIVLIIFFISSLSATDISAKYKVSFGIFGQMGVANTSLHVDKQNRYKISIHVETTGLVNLLSGEREEWHASVGRVDKDGILIPDYYEKIVQRYGYAGSESVLKKDIRKYIFFHDLKKVKVQKTTYRGKNRKYEEKDGEYYAPNDLLSLFFNFKNMLPSLDVKKTSRFYAIGANKKDGHIDIEPLRNPLHAKKEFGWSKGHMMKVIINQKIFASKRGELLVNLRDDGLCKNAVLKDVLLFGDIVGEMIE